MEEMQDQTLEDFLAGLADDTELRDDIREAAYDHWLTLTGQVVDPTADADEGIVEGED